MPTEHFHQARGSSLPEKAFPQSVRHGSSVIVLDAKLRTRGKATDHSIAEVESCKDPNHFSVFEGQDRERTFTFPVRFKEERGRMICARTIHSAKKVPPPLF
jgi:hypothetical protein